MKLVIMDSVNNTSNFDDRKWEHRLIPPPGPGRKNWLEQSKIDTIALYVKLNRNNTETVAQYIGV